MADKKVSELDAITGANTAADDLFLIVDSSGSVTKKITRAELNNAIEQDVLSTVDINGGTIDSTVIGGTTPAAGDFTTLGATGNITVGGTVDGRDVAADGTKLDGIATSATANPNAIDNVVEDTSPQLGGDLQSNGNDIVFADNDKAIFGASSDLSVYHDGSNSYVKDAGTGDLLVQGTQIKLQDASGNDYLRGFTGGAVYLHHSGNTKFETTSSGVSVTGGVVVDQGSGGQGISLQRSSYDTMDIELSESGFRIRNETDGRTDLFIDGSGNVGIGTATPTLDGSLAGLSVNGSGTVLHVNDGDGATLKLTDPATGANRGLGITLQGTSAAISNCESGELRFGTGNTERGRFDASGNLLVGKTADNVATVGIEARATGPLISTRDGSDALRLNRLNSDGEIIQLRQDGSVVGSIKAGNGDLLIGTGEVNLRFFDTTPAVIPRTASDGTSNGVVDLGNASNRFKDGYFSNAVRGNFFAGQADDNTYMGITGGDVITFATGGAERGRFQSSNGVFQIGKTDASLSTSGSYHQGDGFIGATRSANPPLGLNRLSTDGDIVIFQRTGNTVGSIGITSSGVTYNTTSDIRLKQDIEPLAATDKLMQMNPVSYAWKADPDGPRSMGFIAQEMQKVMPEAVSTGEDDDDMMSMDYGRITPILVSALQDAHRKIDELAAEIAELKAN